MNAVGDSEHRGSIICPYEDNVVRVENEHVVTSRIIIMNGFVSPLPMKRVLINCKRSACIKMHRTTEESNSFEDTSDTTQDDVHVVSRLVIMPMM